MQLQTKAVDDIMSIVWSKLILNASVNGLSGILDATLGELYEWQETRDMMTEIISETVKVAEANGIKILHDDPYEYVFGVCRDKASGHYASMCQDVRAKRLTEIDVINGAIVKAGALKNVEAPTNTAVTRLIKAIEKGYKK